MEDNRPKRGFTGASRGEKQSQRRRHSSFARQPLTLILSPEGRGDGVHSSLPCCVRGAESARRRCRSRQRVRVRVRFLSCRTTSRVATGKGGLAPLFLRNEANFWKCLYFLTSLTYRGLRDVLRQFVTWLRFAGLASFWPSAAASD